MYFVWALLLSSLHSILFSLMKVKISLRENFRSGRTIRPLISGIPVNPYKPVPRVKLIRKVSRLSSA